MIQWQRYPLLLALMTALVAFLLNQQATRPPAPVSPQTDRISAYTAFDLLARILGDESPHPTGSVANHRVRDELIQVLAEMGLAVDVQRQWSCSTRASRCAWVENLIAEIPGSETGPYLALMAHYDSVPVAPGAGDDGAGVVAVLETAKRLLNEPTLKWPVLLLLTDAEELGLLGAEAFFANHPKRDQIGLLINIEGSGSSGVSQIIRTHGPNQQLIDLYADAERPSGLSLINEIFKRMPNDTDFSVSKRAGVPGADFAFAAERSRYHTRLDNLALLDLSTLQHHGDNLWPLARDLALADQLTAPRAVSYQGFYGWWLHSPYWVNTSCFLIVSLLMLLATFRQEQPLRLIAASGALAGVMALSLVITWLTFSALWWVKGATVHWPAYDAPLRVLLFCMPLIVLLQCATIKTARRAQLSQRVLAALWIWWLAGLTFLIWLPDALNLVLPVLSFGALLVFFARWLRSGTVLIAALGLLWLAVPGSLGLVLPMEQSQGYHLIVTTLPFLGLFLVLLAPFVTGHHAPLPRLVLVYGALVSIVLVLVLPLHSATRPQHVNFRLVVAPDGAATVATTSSDRLGPDWSWAGPSGVNTQLPFEYGFMQRQVTVPAILSFTKPSVTAVKTIAAGQATYALSIALPTNPDWFSLVVTEARDDLQFELGGVQRPVMTNRWGSLKGQRVLQMNGIQGQPAIELKLTQSGNQPIAGYVVAGHYGLPKILSSFSQGRGETAVPNRTGDHTLSYAPFNLE